MSERVPPATASKGGRQDAPQRSEHASEEDRPFAEIRKNLFDALRILTLRRWAFFIPFCLVSSAAFVLSLYFPRTYSASTTFERRNDPVIMNLPMSAGAASFSHFRTTIERDLTSVVNVAEAVDAMGLSKSFERDEQGELSPAGLKKRNALAASLASTLSVAKHTPSEQIDIITITYTGPDPTIGRSLVDQVKRIYIARTMVWIRDFLQNQREYLVQQASEAAEDLKRAQRDETRLRLENPHVDPTNPGSILTQLSQLEIELRELQLRRRENETELGALEQLLSVMPPHGAIPTMVAERPSLPDTLPPQVMKLSAQLASIKREIADLRETRGMTSEHPQIRDLLATQQRVESELERAAIATDAEPGLGPVITPEHQHPVVLGPVLPWDSDRARLEVQIDAQNTKLSELDFNIETCQHKINELRQAKQDVYQNQEAFEEAIAAVNKARQTHSQLEGAIASIEPTIRATEQGRLLQFTQGQPARGGAIPIKPNAMTIVLLSLLSGAIVGGLIVILAEMFDHVFRTSGQVARGLGIPILEAIDEIVTTSDRRRRLVRGLAMAPVLVLVFGGAAFGTGSLAYLSIQQPAAYERLRALPAAAKRYMTDRRKATAEVSSTESVTAPSTADSRADEPANPIAPVATETTSTEPAPHS